MNWYQLQLIKTADSFFIALWYFSSSAYLSSFIDQKFPKFDKNKYDMYSSIYIFAEIIVTLWAFIVFSRIIRIIYVDYLYSPFEGIIGYKRSLTKESVGSVIFTFSLFIFSDNLKQKITYFGKRIGLIK